MPRPRSALVFDLDGTLVDSVYQHVVAWHEALQQSGIELSIWRIHRRIGMSGGLFTKAFLRETGRDYDPELIEQMSAMYKPIFARALQAQNDETEKLRALVDEIGTFSVQRLEEIGLSAKARMVIYGIGVYPVMRIELRDGNAVFGFIQRIAKRWNYALPAPSEENGHRVWRFDDDKMSVLISLANSELVLAMAPPAALTSTALRS